ncbi:MAG: LacI family transcriptional regulator [Alphaproteobacteria bacterium]|nr:MAG: LacI family transcriptional regulator [Alphaproteobacteria bacterium]
MVSKRRRPTINQVAKEVGVSKATVSRAFSRADMLSKETVERVLKVAREIGYVPNQAARALSTGQHGNIGLIVPDIANPFIPPLISTVQSQSEEADYCVFLGNSDELPEREDRLAKRFSGQVEGLILVSSRLSDDRIRHYAAELPVILVNRDLEGIPRILIDSAVGVTEAMAHLASLGHKHIVYVSGPPKSWSNTQRKKTVKSQGKRLNLQTTNIAANPPSYEAGFKVVEKIVASGATAAIAFDDIIAQGLLAGLASMGIETPGQFSVIGCDDVLGAVTYPQLTSISSAAGEAGRIAARTCIELLENKAMSDIRYVLDTHLVIRDTTGVFPQK